MNRSKKWKFEDVRRKWLYELSDETARAYDGAILRARKSCSIRDFLKVDESTLKVAIAEVGSVAMKRRIVSALHSFFAYALDVGAVPTDPSRRIKVRLLTGPANADLLIASGLGARASWGDVLHWMVNKRSEKSSAEDLSRRLVVRLRRCKTPAALRAMLREPVMRD